MLHIEPWMSTATHCTFDFQVSVICSFSKSFSRFQLAFSFLFIYLFLTLRQLAYLPFHCHGAMMAQPYIAPHISTCLTFPCTSNFLVPHLPCTLYHLSWYFTFLVPYTFPCTSPSLYLIPFLVPYTFPCTSPHLSLLCNNVCCVGNVEIQIEI